VVATRILRPLPARRHNPVQAKPQRHTVAAEDRLDRLLSERLRLAVEERLSRQCCRVARAFRSIPAEMDGPAFFAALLRELGTARIPFPIPRLRRDRHQFDPRHFVIRGESDPMVAQVGVAIRALWDNQHELVSRRARMNDGFQFDQPVIEATPDLQTPAETN
jgi:hypothetical protein